MASQVLRFFPLIRSASRPFLAVLLALPAGPNLVTGLSLVSGLAAAAILYISSQNFELWAAILLIVSYIFDNCDGEIARKKNLTSKFGHRFDSFSDWLVHSCFFLALGSAWHTGTGDPWWLWFGWAAALGSTINYLIALLYEKLDQNALHARQEGATIPNGLYEWFLFVFRELARADFCFLVALLMIFDLHWLLLPTAAAGAQVYWLTQFHAVARRFRV